MKSTGRKRLSITVLVLALGVTATSALVHRDWIAERWYLFRFDTLEDAGRWSLALELEAAGPRGRRVAEDWYLERIVEGDTAHLARAVERLREMRSTRSIEPLLDLSFRESSSSGLDAAVRAAIGEALRALDDAVLPAVVERLDRVRAGVEGDEATRDTVIGTSLCLDLLSRLGDRARAAFPAIARLVNSPEQSIRMHALRSSEALGRGMVPALAEAYRSSSVKGRLRIVSVFVRLGPAAEAAVPALVEALDHDDKLVRATAAKALAKIKGAPWHY